MGEAKKSKSPISYWFGSRCSLHFNSHSNCFCSPMPFSGRYITSPKSTGWKRRITSWRIKTTKTLPQSGDRFTALAHNHICIFWNWEMGIYKTLARININIKRCSTTKQLYPMELFGPVCCIHFRRSLRRHPATNQPFTDHRNLRHCHPLSIQIHLFAVCFGIFLPTIIHVFLFTILFMWSGAKKAIPPGATLMSFRCSSSSSSFQPKKTSSFHQIPLNPLSKPLSRRTSIRSITL